VACHRILHCFRFRAPPHAWRHGQANGDVTSTQRVRVLGLASETNTGGPAPKASAGGRVGLGPKVLD
jgi:hypothetical protein